MANETAISDAEWIVMAVIWEQPPQTAQEIVAALRKQGHADWAAATIKTMLHRLVQKDVLSFAPEGNRYRYQAKVKRSACVRQATRSFLDRVFAGQAGPMLLQFVKSTKLSKAEIAELRRLLDEQEAK